MEDDEVTEAPSSGRLSLSRRVFLRTGTVGVAAAGVLAAIPGASGLLSEGSSAAPEATGAASEAQAGAAEISGPIVAHITDAMNGDLNIFVGEQAIPYRDPALVQRLLQAIR